MATTKHSEYCTFDTCSTFCEVRRAAFAAATAAAKRVAIRDIVDELGHLATPYYLAQAGWPLSSVEAAVRRGDIEWTSSGTLETK